MISDAKRDPKDISFRLPHVFISHAREDIQIAERLYKKLLETEIATVWLDRQSIRGGDKWKDEIKENLKKSQVLIAVFTHQYIKTDRPWINFELLEAERLFRQVIPLKFDDSEIPSHFPQYLRERQYIQFSDDFNEGFLELRNILLQKSYSTKRLPTAAPEENEPFLGREQELAKLHRTIESAKSLTTGRKSVAIQAMGGMGKTMLAQEYLRRAAPMSPGGILLERRGLEPQNVLVVIQKWASEALGQRPDRTYSPNDLRGILTQNFGEILVLIDDVDQSDFASVRKLIEALPTTAIKLLTTRHKSIKTELKPMVLHLERLSEEDAKLLLLDRINDSEELSRDVSLKLKKSVLTKTLKELVKLVAGHPLSLDLIISSCHAASDILQAPEKLKSDLFEIFDLHIDTDDEEHQKKTSLVKCLYISLKSLEKGEDNSERGRYFRSLGIIPDGALFGSAMSSAIWGDDKVDGASPFLEDLFRRAMVERSEDGKRYLFHPSIHEFVVNLLKKNSSLYAKSRKNYIRYVTGVAMRGFERQPQDWGDMLIYMHHWQHVAGLLETEIVDSSSSLQRWALPEVRKEGFPINTEASIAELRMGLDFSNAIMPFVVKRPEIAEMGLRWLQLGIVCARVLSDTGSELKHIGALGQWHERRDPKQAESFYKVGIELARKLKNVGEEGILLSYYGELLRTMNKPALALEVLNEAIKIHQEQGNRYMEATTLKFMGATYWQLTDLDRALELHELSLNIYCAIEDRAGEGDMLNNIGSVSFKKGNYEDAINHFKQALAIHREVGNQSMEAVDLNDMGISYKYLGRFKEALSFLKKAIKLHEKTGNQRVLAITMNNIAQVYFEQSNIEEMAKWAEKALEIAQNIDCHAPVALMWLAIAYHRRNDLPKADELFQKSLDLSKETKDKRDEAGILGNFGFFLHSTGKSAAGLSMLRKGLKILIEHKIPVAYGGRSREEFERIIAELVKKPKA